MDLVDNIGSRVSYLTVAVGGNSCHLEGSLSHHKCRDSDGVTGAVVQCHAAASSTSGQLLIHGSLVFPQPLVPRESRALMDAPYLIEKKIDVDNN